jgi:hypothetical protein
MRKVKTFMFEICLMRAGRYVIICCAACLLFFLHSCRPSNAPVPPAFDAAFVRLSPLEIAALPLAVRFDPPLGSENAALVYNAQPFRTSRHLGDDLNGIGGWDSDLGDPIYSAGAGRVVFCAEPSEGWGKMVILAHRVPEASAMATTRVCLTVYAHVEQSFVRVNDLVRRGQKIATVGTANGRYLAHLHFEVRESLSIYPGAGYSDSALDRVSPEAFITEHHDSSADRLCPAP